MEKEKIPEFDFKGIKRIEIPKTDLDFANDANYGFYIIKKYLPSVIATHNKNRAKIDFLYNYFLGEQDILAKKRPYDSDKFNNNKIVENHANRQVEFKVGFLTGETRDYTHKSDSDSDDLVYLDRYFTDCNFFSKDKALKKWVYATGIGTTYTAPRTDIIIDDGNATRFATPEEGYDVNFQAPFEFDTVDPRDNFVVYSSGYNKEPLFCVSIVDVDKSTENDPAPIIVKQIQIETRYASFKVESDTKFSTYTWLGVNGSVTVNPKSLKYLPMIEYSVNDDRLGIIEKNRSLLNSINTFRSAVADMTTDSSNAILVFKNVDIDAEEVKAMKEAGAIIISDAPNARQGSTASLDTIKIEIPFEGLNQYIDQLLQNCYDIAGVPMASGQVTSGGDTGQARLLGGGWNNAYIMINNDVTTLKGYDYEELKLILYICRQVPNCPINELYASQIDINYRINQNDNFMVKTQGMKYLYDMNMPLEFILKVSRLSNDVKTDSKNWQERIDKLHEQALEDESRNNSGNNSQE